MTDNASYKRDNTGSSFLERTEGQSGTAAGLSGGNSGNGGVGGAGVGGGTNNNDSKVSQDSASARFDKHEKRARFAHRLLWFAIILLLLLIGRSFFESLILRQSNNDLRDAVESQTLTISQAGSVAPNLGAGLAPPGTTLQGPDGQTYICPAGPAGNAGVSGSTGTPGSAGGAGGPGFSVTAGAGLSDVDGSANVVLDINPGGGLSISSDFLNVLGADGTIFVSSSGVKVGLINDSNLNSGFGTGQVSAADILIQDLGGFYLSGNVEGALQEAGPVVAAGLQNLDDTYNNFGAVVGPTITVDGAEGQSGSLTFDLTTTQDLAIQDAGVNFAIFDDTGNVSFYNDFGVGAAAGAESLSNVGFFPNGNDAFIADSLGVEGTIYSDTGLTVGSLSEAPTTTYGKGLVASAGALSMTSGAGGDIAVTSAGDITLTPSGADVFVSDLLTITTGTGLDDPSLRLVNSATPETVDLITGPSDPATASVVAPAGSLYMRDAAGADGGELWIKSADAASGWSRLAQTNSTTLDTAYNNFGATAPTITIDGSEGQTGPLTFNTLSDDLVIEKTGTFSATFFSTGGLKLDNQSTAKGFFVVDGSGAYGGPTPATAVEISQRNTGLTRHALFINNMAPADTVLIDDNNTTASHFGLQLSYDRGTLTSGTSGAARILATNTGLSGDGLVQVDAAATASSAFKFIEMRSSVTGTPDVKFLVDGTGAVYNDNGTYTSPADYAEYFKTGNTDLVPGEIVAVDSNNADSVKRAVNGDLPLGIISTKPAVVANDKLGVPRDQHPKTDALVGLLGQLPVIVNEQNGPISIGDYITISDTPGQGRKADPGEPTIGVALSAADSENKANVLLAPSSGGLAPSLAANVSSSLSATTGNISSSKSKDAQALALSDTQTYKDLTVLNQIAATKIQVLKDLEVRGTVSADSLVVDAEATFHGAVELAGHIIVGQDTAGQISIKAGEQSARVDFKNEYQQPPFVQLTPLSFGPKYRLEKVTTKGFVVSLENATQKDLKFNWFAVDSNSTEANLPGDSLP